MDRRLDGVESDELADLFFQAWRGVRHTAHRRGSSMTSEQYWILRTLEKEGPVRVADLSRRMELTPSSVSISVKRLERAGAVRRSRSRSDERVVTVTLTEDGALALSDWRKERLRPLADVMRRLDERDKQHLRMILSKIISAQQAALREGKGGDRKNGAS